MPGPLSRAAPQTTAPATSKPAAKPAAPAAPPKPAVAGSADELTQAKKKLQSLGLTSTKHAPVTRTAGPAMTPAQLMAQSMRSAVATGTAAFQQLGASDGFGHHSAKGKISAKEWEDPTLLMGKLTQYPAGKKTAQSEAVCGPSNLLGAKMLSGGPDEAGKFLIATAYAPQGKLTSAERTELAAIGQRVLERTASFEDLNKAQELLYRSVNVDADGMAVVAMAAATGKLKPAEEKKLRQEMLNYINSDDPMRRDSTEINKLLKKAFGPDADFEKGGWNRMDVTDSRRTKDTSGLSDAELEPLGKLAGGEQLTLDQHTDFEELAKNLRPGESLTFRLAGDDKSGAPDHYVTLGRRPDPDGRVYLYNPDPANKDHTLSVGAFPPDAKFNKTLAKYTDRLRTEGDGFPPATRTPKRT